MEVQIQEVVSSVRTVDSEALLTPQVMQQIVSVVLRAVREDQAHGERLRAEQRINSGRDVGTESA
jgi:hypothetical protein